MLGQERDVRTGAWCKDSGVMLGQRRALSWSIHTMTSGCKSTYRDQTCRRLSTTFCYAPVKSRSAGFWNSLVIRHTLLQQHAKIESCGHQWNLKKRYYFGDLLFDCSKFIVSVRSRIASTNWVYCFTTTAKSATCSRPCFNVGPTPASIDHSWSLRARAASTKHWPNVVLILGQRRRRWPRINTTLGQCLVFWGTCAED